MAESSTFAVTIEIPDSVNPLSSSTFDYDENKKTLKRKIEELDRTYKFARQKIENDNDNEIKAFIEQMIKDKDSKLFDLHCRSPGFQGVFHVRGFTSTHVVLTGSHKDSYNHNHPFLSIVDCDRINICGISVDAYTWIPFEEWHKVVAHTIENRKKKLHPMQKINCCILFNSIKEYIRYEISKPIDYNQDKKNDSSDSSSDSSDSDE